MTAAWRISVYHAATGTLKGGFPKVLEDSHVAEWTARVEGDSLDSGEFNSLEARLTVDPQNAMMDPFDGVQIEWSDLGNFTDTRSLFHGFVETGVNPENFDDFQDVALAGWKEFLDGCIVNGEFAEQDAAQMALKIMQAVKASGQIPCVTVPASIPNAGYTVGKVTGNGVSARELLEKISSLFQQDNSDPQRKCLWGVSAAGIFFFGVRTVAATPVDLQVDEGDVTWQGKSNRSTCTRMQWLATRPASTLAFTFMRQFISDYVAGTQTALPFTPKSIMQHESSSGYPLPRYQTRQANTQGFTTTQTLPAATSTTNVVGEANIYDTDPATFAALGADGASGSISWVFDLSTFKLDQIIGLEFQYATRYDGSDVNPSLSVSIYRPLGGGKELGDQFLYILPITNTLNTTESRKDTVAFMFHEKTFDPAITGGTLTITISGGGASGLTPTEGLRIFGLRFLKLDTLKLDAYATYFYDEPGSVAGEVTRNAIICPPKRKLTLTRIDGEISSGLNIDHYEYRALSGGDYGITVLHVGQPDNPDKVAYWASVRNGDTKAEVTAVTGR